MFDKRFRQGSTRQLEDLSETEISQLLAGLGDYLATALPNNTTFVLLFGTAGTRGVQAVTNVVPNLVPVILRDLADVLDAGQPGQN